MIRVTMSIRGLQRYDGHLFDDMVLPEDLVREDIIEEILTRCADLELLYPEPITLRNAIGRWSRRMLPIWEKLLATLEYEYDPIANYDRHETHGRELSREYSSSGTSEGETTGSRNAYNGGWTDTDRATSDAETAQSGTQGEEESIEIRAYGNIGVTTTQQMIEEQRRVVRFDLSEEIVEEFRRRFCLLIY